MIPVNTKLSEVIRLIVLACLASGVATAGAAHAAVAHDFVVDIQPERGEIRVKDRITLPPGADELVLTGAARTVEWASAGLREAEAPPGKRLFVLDTPGVRNIDLEYVLPLAAPGGRRTGSAGQDVLWDGSGPWYAEVPGHMLTFTLSVTTPAQWRVVSQGARLENETLNGTRRAVWRESQPQQEVYLIAAPFTEYLRDTNRPRLMVFLRQPDETLAARYLDLASQYIEMYEKMIGDYPYAKFALVENTRETGFAMPSFTLLGPRVIRLPFIPYTSYPHEILHNWWGNSVYVDYRGGNWGEGLTTYLSDHWLKEQRGEGPGYRRDALQKYMDFVSGDKDFPLSRFRARHGEATRAVGYNKSMMLFHMLRKRLGDKVFFAALRDFYQDYLFREASFTDLRKTFEAAGGENLQQFFEQWVARTGAPALELGGVRLETVDDSVILRGRLRQTQPGAVYSLDVPVRITTDAGSSRHWIVLDSRELDFEIQLAQRPSSMTVDSDFDVFRRLDVAEVPPSLGAAFGSARLTFVIPHGASESERRAYEAFMAPWHGADRAVRMITDASLLPDTGAVWLLGWDNALRPLLAEQLRPYGVTFARGTMELEGRRYGRPDHTLALAVRDGEGVPLLWTHLADSDPEALSRRLRHYSRVSYVAFEDDEAVSQGQWPVLDSPLTRRFGN